MDNITAPGVGAIIATDQIGTTHYPRSKTGFGVEGVYTDVSADNPLPVTDLAAGLVFTLASNVALAAGEPSQTITVPVGGYFFFDAAFTGTSPSLKLQRLGADGASWIDVITRTAAGSGDPVGIPNGSQLRVINAGTNAMTAVSAVLG